MMQLSFNTAAVKVCTSRCDDHKLWLALPPMAPPSPMMALNQATTVKDTLVVLVLIISYIPSYRS